MKIRIGFKCPDAVDYAVTSMFEDVEPDPETGDKVIDELTAAEVKEKLAQWVQYGENITIEFDLKNGVAKVLKQ